MFPEVTPALCTLAQTPTIGDISAQLPTIEIYIVLMYDRGSSDDKVNRTRQTLFTQKGREIENIPPTQDVLYHHFLRVGYQAGHIWGQALHKAPKLPSPAFFGWMRNKELSKWIVIWMSLPPAGAACRAVIKCGCTKTCSGRCRCANEKLPCTLLCKCGGCKRDE